MLLQHLYERREHRADQAREQRDHDVLGRVPLEPPQYQHRDSVPARGTHIDRGQQDQSHKELQ